jgi:hypothetical protein
VALHRGLEIADNRCHLHGGPVLKLSHFSFSLISIFGNGQAESPA